MTTIYSSNGKPIKVVAPPVSPMGLDALILPMYPDVSLIGVTSFDPTIMQIGMESQLLDDDIINFIFKHENYFMEQYGTSKASDMVPSKTAHLFPSHQGRISKNLIYHVPVASNGPEKYSNEEVLYKAFSAAFEVVQANKMVKVGIADVSLFHLLKGTGDEAYLGIAARAAKSALENPNEKNLMEVNLITMHAGRAEQIKETYLRLQ